MLKTSTAVALRQHEIPFFAPSIGEAEIEAVVETLRSGWLTTGPKVRQFEEAFGRRVGARHALATSSATAALHLALEAAGVGPGDEVLVPTLTFASTGEVVVHRGAKPVLVDCNPQTLNMDPDDARRKVTRRTKAVMPVHYGGQPCDMDPVLDLARRHGLKVIEDAAHALPARYGDQHIGTIGDVTCFSFYANKTITTGEGGMLTTNDDQIAERVRIMRLHGISKDAWKRFSAEGSWYYEIHGAGYKYNMTDMQAALGIHQLARCDEFWAARQRIAERYDAGLADLAEVVTPWTELNVQHAWHLYVIQLQLDRLRIDRNRFIELLNQAGIGVSVHYLPLHMHPYYRDTFGYRPQDSPNARDAYYRIISLPIYPKLADEQVDFVVETLARIVAENRKVNSIAVCRTGGDGDGRRKPVPNGLDRNDPGLAAAPAAGEVGCARGAEVAEPAASPRMPGLPVRATKRTFDIMMSAAGLLVLSPLFAAVAVLIKLTSRGPVFFLQERVGRGMRPFRIIKFRTMIQGAHKMGRLVTAGKDPRITPLGYFLRRMKIDELPQLINVLKGDMSFVGPRPEVAKFVELYREDFAQLLVVRPGITDLASLKYRHEADILGRSADPERTYVERVLPEKIALSKQYVARASLWLDLKLILATLLRLVY
ncbi:MAG TPA: aminotransferase class I/II-fold pyridoxal phosphate-dependent enzyme [Planctomycetes bacterium]|nr:aminotransferase class I/II-fold pyridoxal phosphate-dependent enzyme [Planctomycetota bacterium]